MNKINPPKPTNAEFDILQVLWNHGKSTVRQVQEILQAKQNCGYTTVLKLLQIMTEKGLVVRDETNRTHVYEARFTEADTQQLLIDDLLSRAFGGSKTRFINALVNDEQLNRDQFEKLRKEIVELRKSEDGHESDR